jgi:hypothetical protein
MPIAMPPVTPLINLRNDLRFISWERNWLGDEVALKERCFFEAFI